MNGRLAIGLGAGLLLAGLVTGAAVLGGGSDGPAQAPPECVDAWNADPDAVAYGIHNFGGHGYTEALVTRLTADAEPADRAGGFCAVTFPALALDREPVAAGQLFRAERWTPISDLEGVELTRVAELQAEAAAGSNATLGPEGILAGSS